MAEVLDIKKAKEVYGTLIKMLDGKKWKYEKVEDKLMIRSSIKGQDFPIEFVVFVKPDKQVVQFLSSLPFSIPQDKRVDAAIAVCVANYDLCEGCFDYDMSDGQLVFRLTYGYRKSNLSAELLEHMIMISAATVDRYNGKFFMIAKNMMSVQQFIDQEQQQA